MILNSGEKVKKNKPEYDDRRIKINGWQIIIIMQSIRSYKSKD
jgi:hypothetical protein